MYVCCAGLASYGHNAQYSNGSNQCVFFSLFLEGITERYFRPIYYNSANSQQHQKNVFSC